MWSMLSGMRSVFILGALALALIVAVFGWVSDATCLIVGITLIFGLSWRSIRPFALVTLAASPPCGPYVVGAITAVPAWRDGSAGHYTHGNSGMWGMNNLDPEGRFYPRNDGLGCLVTPIQVAVYGGAAAGHNAMLHVLGVTFGPPKGVYTGPIPMQEELVEAFVTRRILVGAEVEEGVLHLPGGSEIHLVPPREFTEAHGFSPAAIVEAEWVAVLGYDGVMAVWARETGAPVAWYRSEDRRLAKVAVLAGIGR